MSSIEQNWIQELGVNWTVDYQWLYRLMATALVVIIFNLFIKGVLQKLQRRYHEKHHLWKSTFIDALYFPLSIYVWYFAIIYSIELIDSCINGTPCLEKASLLLSLGTTAAIGWFAFRWKKGVIKALNAQNKKSDGGLEMPQIDAIDKLITLLICFVLIIWVLEATGKGIGTLLTIGGIGAAAFGFASKEFIANFFGGLTIYLTKPFAVGDMISVPQINKLAYVEEIGWYLTRVRDLEMQPIFIPNSTFSSCIVITPSRRSHRLFKEIIGIRYKDIAATTPIIEEIRHLLSNHPDMDRQQRQMVHLHEFASSSLNIQVYGYTKTVDIHKYNDIKQDILLKVFDIIIKHGAEMAFPTTTLDIPSNITFTH